MASRTLVPFKLPVHGWTLEPCAPNSTKVAFFREGKKTAAPVLSIGDWIKLFVRLLSKKTGWMPLLEETKDQFVPLRILNYHQAMVVEMMRTEIERFRRQRPILPVEMRRNIRARKSIVRGGIKFFPTEAGRSPPWTLRRDTDTGGLAGLAPFEIEFSLLVEFGAIILSDEWVAEFQPTYSVPWLPFRKARAWSRNGCLVDKDAFWDWEEMPREAPPAPAARIIEAPPPAAPAVTIPVVPPRVLPPSDSSTSRLLSLVVEIREMMSTVQLPAAQQSVIAALGAVLPLAEQSLRSIGVLPGEPPKASSAAKEELQAMHDALKQAALAELSARAEAVSAQKLAAEEALKRIAEVSADLSAREARLSSERESLNRLATELDQGRKAHDLERVELSAEKQQLLDERQVLQRDFEALSTNAADYEPKKNAIAQSMAELKTARKEFETYAAQERRKLEEVRSELEGMREMVTADLEKISQQERELADQRAQFNAERNKPWKQVLRELSEPASR